MSVGNMKWKKLSLKIIYLIVTVVPRTDRLWFIIISLLAALLLKLAIGHDPELISTTFHPHNLPKIPTKILYAFLISLILATYPPLLTVLFYLYKP
jgi:hypothetical protein